MLLPATVDLYFIRLFQCFTSIYLVWIRCYEFGGCHNLFSHIFLTMSFLMLGVDHLIIIETNRTLLESFLNRLPTSPLASRLSPFWLVLFLRATFRALTPFSRERKERSKIGFRSLDLIHDLSRSRKNRWPRPLYHRWSTRTQSKHSGNLSSF